MKFVKVGLFIGIFIAFVEMSFSLRLRKENTNTKCKEGKFFNEHSNNCEANKNTITQGDKQLEFYSKYTSPKIVETLPVFKYDDKQNQNDQDTHPEKTNEEKRKK
jgi:hypothetical protein